MIWVYLSWLILLIGTSIAYYHQHPDKIPDKLNHATLSNRMKEKAALLAMYHIARNFHENRAPWPINELAEKLNIPSEALTEILQALEHDRLLIRHEDQTISYLPAQSLENIQLIRILESIRDHGESSRMNSDSMQSEKPVDDLISTVYAAISESTSRLSLRDFISSHNYDHKE
jgi:membrane protein